VKILFACQLPYKFKKNNTNIGRRILLPARPEPELRHTLDTHPGRGPPAWTYIQVRKDPDLVAAAMPAIGGLLGAARLVALSAAASSSSPGPGPAVGQFSAGEALGRKLVPAPAAAAGAAGAAPPPTWVTVNLMRELRPLPKGHDAYRAGSNR
jgi:hypothetical protein